MFSLDSESPSPELPYHGELEQLHEVTPTKPKPEIPYIPVDIRHPDFWDEMYRQDEERKKPKQPPIH